MKKNIFLLICYINTQILSCENNIHSPYQALKVWSKKNQLYLNTVQPKLYSTWEDEQRKRDRGVLNLLKHEQLKQLESLLVQLLEKKDDLLSIAKILNPEKTFLKNSKKKEIESHLTPHEIKKFDQLLALFKVYSQAHIAPNSHIFNFINQKTKPSDINSRFGEKSDIIPKKTEPRNWCC